MAEARGWARAKDNRLRALDGLRLLAALAVVAFHYTGRDSVAWGESVRTVFPSLSRFTIYGGFGPYLFFIISGFVVLMSAWGRSVPAFLASRVGRLYPAYWCAVLLTAGVLYVWPLVPVWRDLRTSGVALNLTMFQSAFGVGHVDGVYWTLWVELKFYLLLVVMMLIGITRATLLILCFVWPVLGALASQAQAHLLVALLEPDFAPFFCIGILLYLLYRQGWNLTVGLLLGLNYAAALWVCASYYLPWSMAVAGAPVSFRGLALLLTLCIASVAVATLTPVARVGWRWLTVAGALTYPLYLLHQRLGWVILNRVGTFAPVHLAVVLLVVLMLGLAYAVHRLVEQPVGRWLRRSVEHELTALVQDDAPIRPHEHAAPAARRPLAVPAPAPRPRPRPSDDAVDVGTSGR